MLHPAQVTGMKMAVVFSMELGAGAWNVFQPTPPFGELIVYKLRIMYEYREQHRPPSIRCYEPPPNLAYSVYRYLGLIEALLCKSCYLKELNCQEFFNPFVMQINSSGEFCANF